MSVRLHSVRYENHDAPVLVIHHGLLGSARNWSMIGKALQDRFDVHVVDLRNHGGSPHAESMRWSELVDDLSDYFEEHGLSEAVLMGHSLGGKVAMRFACEYPDRVGRLVVVDIAAKDYSPHLDEEFRAMKAIDVSELGSRREAEAALEPLIDDWAHRQFLLTNLVREKSTGRFCWQVNVDALHASLPHVRKNSLRSEDRYDGPALLVRGSSSAFIKDGDAEAMREWIPRVQEVSVAEAGHNVHVENRNGFLAAVAAFLES